MNAIDILGAILGRRSQSKGGAIVKDVVNPERTRPKAERRPAPRRQAEYEPESDFQFGSDTDDDFEDLMRDAYRNFDQKTGGQYRDSLPTEPSGRRAQDHARDRRSHRDLDLDRDAQRPEPRSFGVEPRSFDDPRDSRNEQRQQQATLLIRAMVMAAKSDGRIDQTEQDQIVGELGGRVGQSEIDFLKQEFARPVDIRAFARSVPRGMEFDVYAASLMAIDLDTNPEARHLHELATAFGISPEECNRIHARYNAPNLY